ncbi:MAG TPA: hypothetical protein ENN25_07440 [Euryarchaeota archaeon]|nr:hypothetical protein [Euryarchaeota archaeon]
MKLWDFKMMRDGKIAIGDKIAEPLGLLDESEVFTTMFRYESGGSSSYEVVISPFGPENYREICYVTFQIKDVPGSLAQCARFLKTRNIDILNSESVSFMPSVAMTWVMLVDLSFFGDRESLEREFAEAREAQDSSISLIDSIVTEPSNLAERYTKGFAADNPAITTRALRKMEKNVTVIEKGALRLPEAYLNFFGKRDAPVMLIGDTESWILSISFLADETDLWRMKFTIPDKPGSVYEISNAMSGEKINILAGYTQVLVYYQKMLYEIIADISGCKCEHEAFEELVRNKISSLGGDFSVMNIEAVPFR